MQGKRLGKSASLRLWQLCLGYSDLFLLEISQSNSWCRPHGRVQW